MLRPIAIAFGRALISQLHYRMLLLSIVPFLGSALIWGVILWLGMNPMVESIRTFFAENGGFRIAGSVLESLGLGTLKFVIAPLIAMWILLPLMILTALLFIGVLAMPLVVRHLSARGYAGLELRRGGTFLGSAWRSASAFVVFAVLWIVSLPLAAIPPLGFVIQPLLWGWLTYRVLAYDALAAHADAQELERLLREQRWPLLAIGTVTGAMGAAPTLLWLGGALSVVLFPLLAGVSIWLYVLVFIFTGLWFAHFCLDALAQMRAAASVPAVPGPAPALKDIN